jgi:hypothetical protein
MAAKNKCLAQSNKSCRGAKRLRNEFANEAGIHRPVPAARRRFHKTMTLQEATRAQSKPKMQKETTMAPRASDLRGWSDRCRDHAAFSMLPRLSPRKRDYEFSPPDGDCHPTLPRGSCSCNRGDDITLQRRTNHAFAVLEPPMSQMGQSRRFRDVRVTSAYAPRAATKRTWKYFAFVPTVEVINAGIRRIAEQR